MSGPGEAPGRAAVIAAWRAVLDALEPHESLPMPVFGSGRAVFHLYGTVAQGQMAALEEALPCEFTESISDEARDDPWFRLTGEIGGVPVVITAQAALVADKQVIGRHVVEDVGWVRKPLEPATESEAQ